MLNRAARSLLLAAAMCAILPAAAMASHFTKPFPGTTIIYVGDDGVDQISGIDTGTTYRFTRFGGAALGLEDAPDCVIDQIRQDMVVCPKAGVTSLVINLGADNDVATFAPSVTVPVIFNGGPGNDGLFGGGGIDLFDGGSGDDNVVTRDNLAESVNCGAGNDTAISDDADTRTSCEQIEGDADGDGVRRPADCDDTKPNIRPGVPDIPDNKIDEDCTGDDSTAVDRDGDGSARPLDCDDSSAAIRPGATEVVGNRVDENCDERAAPFPPVTGSVAGEWGKIRGRTVNIRLLARSFAAGTRIEVVCSGQGCPFQTRRRTIRNANRTVNLHRILGERRLRRGIRLDLRFSRKSHIGLVLRYRMQPGGELPHVDFLCQPPGGSVRDC